VIAAALALAVVLAFSLISVAGSSKPAESMGASSPAELVSQPSTQRGGDLKALMAFDCGTWDPAVSVFTQGCLEVQRLFLRQLVTFSPGPGPTRLVPDLARAVPTSSDQRTWRYDLKPGLRWEDGRPITSYDVKYGIERAFAPELAAIGLFVKNNLVGADGYSGPYRDKAGLQSIETPDPLTIVFHLSSPLPDWNYVMAEPYASPVPEARDTGANYGIRPVASGPYKFAEYQPAHSLSLVRNEEWVRSSDPARAALPDRLEIRFVTSNGERDRLISSDAADLDITGMGLFCRRSTEHITRPSAATAPSQRGPREHRLAVVVHGGQAARQRALPTGRRMGG